MISVHFMSHLDGTYKTPERADGIHAKIQITLKIRLIIEIFNEIQTEPREKKPRTSTFGCVPDLCCTIAGCNSALIKVMANRKTGLAT